MPPSGLKHRNFKTYASGYVFGPLLVLVLFAVPQSAASAEPTYKSLARPFLTQYCIACHDGDSELPLNSLGPVDANNATTWKAIWEQVALQEMPPADEDQPNLTARHNLSLWISSELERSSRDKGGFYLHHTPQKANHLDHELLFGTLELPLKPTATPARIWRIHPDEHLTRVNALMHPEPEFDPDRPGLRTRGDAVRTKIFYGYNRIIGWIGGGNQYRNSGLAYIAPLSLVDQHGLKNYPLYYSVNRSETLQLLS